jgi:hypothetical protein
VLALFRKTGRVENLTASSRNAQSVYAVAHKNGFRPKDAVGYPTPPENERAFIEALKRREDYAIRLARKYGVGICKANRLAHEILGTYRFRPGVAKPPLSSNFPQKHFGV